MFSYSFVIVVDILLHVSVIVVDILLHVSVIVVDILLHVSVIVRSKISKTITEEMYKLVLACVFIKNQIERKRKDKTILLKSINFYKVFFKKSQNLQTA
jgi:hypothetical protein